MRVLALVAVLVVGLLYARGGAVSSRNLQAFLALIRQAESKGDYTVIAGGDHFNDFSEHPFIVNRDRVRPLGTTASGAYQIVRQTWIEARAAIELPDFSPPSQDKAAAWLIDRRGALELVEAGQFDDAIVALGNEWEAFKKMAAGDYYLSMDQARAFIEANGGTYA